MIWEGPGKQILTIFTVDPLFGCVFGPYLGWSWKADFVLFTVDPPSWCVFELYFGMVMVAEFVVICGRSALWCLVGSRFEVSW